jgi:uncharacterized metal-binding protein YceD (DUF177 family)
VTEPLTWTHRASEIPDTGLRVSKAATEAERIALAEALEVISCEAAKADYTIRAIGGARYRLSGEVSARLTQACVVTLEPLSTELKEGFEVEFWPPDVVPGAPSAEVEVSGLRDIEPIEHGTMDAGRIVFETLAAAIDPYPRKEGAELQWRGEEGEASEPEPANPFSKLKGLKTKS